MAFIEQSIRTAIVSALKQLEFKKYDVEREDFIDVLAADMCGIMFPKGEGVTLPPVTLTATAVAATEETKKKKPGPKPKPKTTTEDVVKLTAPLTKKAKALAGESFDKKKLMDYLNSLGKEGYASKSFDEHIKTFYQKKEEEPRVVESDGEGMEMEEHPFEGKIYLVDPNTKRVYEEDSTGLPIPIGYAGMGKFEGLKVL